MLMKPKKYEYQSNQIKLKNINQIKLMSINTSNQRI